MSVVNNLVSSQNLITAASKEQKITFLSYSDKLAKEADEAKQVVQKIIDSDLTTILKLAAISEEIKLHHSPTYYAVLSNEFQKLSLKLWTPD